MMRNKEICRGIALVFIVLITGLFSAGICVAGPTVPLLISPNSGATLPQPSEPWTFDWTDSSDPDWDIIQYRLYVIHEHAQIPLIDDYVKDSYYSKTLGSYISNENLKGWTWKVRAQSGDGDYSVWSDWSETWRFDVEARDTTPPTVIDNTPTGENVTVTTRITITFSEPMDKESVKKAFSIYPEVYGEFDWEENTTIFTPSSYLDYDTNYTIQIYDAWDLAGNSLYWHEWKFSTAPPNNPPNMPVCPSGPSSGYAGLSYSYSTSAKDPDGDGIKYTFDWGDFTTSETEFVKSGEMVVQSHVWEEPGEYGIRVKATDDEGANSKWSESLIVVARTSELIPPTAIISATPGEINEGKSVSFSAEASSDKEGDIVSYDWDFGDGDTDTGINVEHTYSHSGHYTATLTVTDNDDLSHSGRIAITVNPLVTPNAPPTAYIGIYPTPATEGEEVTFEGYGEDEDGEVVECRWTLPDGRTFSDSGSSSWFTLESEEVHAGWYSFAVRDDDGALSKEAGLYLELEPEPALPPPLPWTWILAATALVIAAVPIIRRVNEELKKRRGNGSIHADSNPPSALTFLDEVYSGLSPATVPEVPVGTHNVKFRKFGYFDCSREAVVNTNQTAHVHCDLTEIPGIKLKLSAEPTEIPADGKSKSVITIRIEDKKGIPIPVPEDVTVELVTNNGTIESPVKIPAGRTSVTATLTSSVSEGTAKVEAKALFLKGGTTVEFLQST